MASPAGKPGKRKEMVKDILKKRTEFDQFECNEENYLKLKFNEKKYEKIFKYFELEKKKIEEHISALREDMQKIQERTKEKEKERQIAEQKLQEIGKVGKPKKLQPLALSQTSERSNPQPAQQ